MPKTVPLDFSEITWVAYKLSGAAGALVVELIKLINWLLSFGCASKEFRVIVDDLAEWMNNSSPLGPFVASLHWISAQWCAP